MPNKKDMLQEAMEAGQKGDLARARELLRKLIQKNDKEALYWLLMSTVVESREERIESLNNVLALEPNNSAAKQDLRLLGVPLPAKEKPSKKSKKEKVHSGEESADAAMKQDAVNSSHGGSWSAGQFIGGLTLLILGYLAANSGAFVSPPESTDDTSPKQISEISGSLPTQLGPSDFLTVTLTPTPIYVNTPHPESSSYQRGFQAYEAGDWLEAVAQFEEHLARESASADAVYYLGLSYFGLGEIETAKAMFEHSINLNPLFAPAYLGRARAEMQLTQGYPTLINDLNTAILLDPENTEAFLARAMYYLDRNELVLAQADINRAELLSPLSPMVHARKAFLFSEMGSYDLALAAAQLAYSLDITLLSNYPVLGKAYLEMEQASKAIEIVQRYLTFEAGDGEAWQLLGLCYQQNGEELSALGAFEKALELYPNLPQAAYYLGIKDQENGDIDSALAKFRSTVSGAPNWFEAHITFAQALKESGDLNEAFVEVNFGRDLVETNEQLAIFHYWRATILEALGQEDSALRDWLVLFDLPAEVMPPEWRQLAELRSGAQ